MPENVGRQGANEYLMWGGGHVLQFANTALMLCAFYLISRAALGETPLSASWLKIVMLVLVAGAAVGPLLYVTHEAGGATQRDLFTRLYWYALPVPTTVVLGSVAFLLFRRWKDAMNGAPEIKAIAAALFLFAYGGVLGFFEGSVDTRTPSHYHAMLIAVTLAFMALYFALFLPLLGRRTKRQKLRTAMYLLLGGGQFLHSTGLYLAGLEGVLRKTPGAAQGLDSPWKIATMSLMGLGGLIAVIGGIIFIFLAGKMLVGKPGPER
jgi:heme/copper-type cytochrome/quinol oxidase subunit 1